MITIVAFIIVLGILIFIHELGHFMVAKWVGVRVEKFSLGFGPKVLGFRRKETEYLISLLPLGGYVKLAGENPEEELKNDPSEFASRSVGDRTRIVIAGPIMNLLLALLLFPVVFMIGTEVPSYLKKAPVLGYVEADSPAMEAGFEPGDTIVRIDGAAIATWGELDNIVMTSPNNSMTVSFLREGAFMETTLTPSMNEAFGTGYAGLVHQIEPGIGGLNPGYPAERAGMKLGDRIVAIEGIPVHHWNQIPQLISQYPDKEIAFTVQRGEEKRTLLIKPKLDETSGTTRHLIGISPLMETVIEQYGVFESLKKGTMKFGEMTVMTFYVLKRLVTRKLSVKTLGGPILIAQITGQAAKSGISNLLLFMAFLSLNLGILNLLPIPVLDGGHIVFLLIEFLRGKPLGVKKMEIAQQVGLVLLILLMLVVTYNDIQRILPWNIGDFFSGK